MANQYILDLSKNVKRGIIAKLEKGGFPNLAPIGYINNKWLAKEDAIPIKIDSFHLRLKKYFEMNIAVK